QRRRLPPGRPWSRKRIFPTAPRSDRAPWIDPAVLYNGDWIDKDVTWKGYSVRSYLPAWQRWLPVGPWSRTRLTRARMFQGQAVRTWTRPSARRYLTKSTEFFHAARKYSRCLGGTSTLMAGPMWWWPSTLTPLVQAPGNRGRWCCSFA